MPRLIEETLDGTEVVICQDDRPVARLMPIQSVASRIFGSAKGRILLADNFDEVLDDFAEYQKSPD